MNRTSVQNYLALEEVVRHLRGGPRSLTLGGISDEQWLESFLKMSQTTLTPEGQLEALSLYEVPLIISPARLLPIVRYLSWNRRADRDRCRLGVVRWPDVAIQYFRLVDDDLAHLDGKIRELQRAVPKVPIQISGLNLDRLYGTSSKDDAVLAPPPSDRAPFRRWTHLGSSTGTFTFDFVEGDSPGVDDAWLTLWNELSARRTIDKSIPTPVENYTVRPEDLAEVLTKEFN